MVDQNADFARQFIDAIPHARALGMRLDKAGDGAAVMRLPYREEFVGDPETGVIAGGAVFALVDTCGGAAVMAHKVGTRGTATLDLRIDYMRGATPGQEIVAEAECYHTTRTVAFCRITAYDEDRARPVATATGAFTLELRSKKGASK